MSPRPIYFFPLFLLTALLALPLLALLASWAGWGEQSLQVLVEMGRTVLPDYLGTSLMLCLLVAIGVAGIGLSSALAVTLFDFPGRRVFEWALLLPLAMPAYVVAYAYTDFLQFSGPLQTSLRAWSGLEGRMFPEVRNLGGAAWVLTFTLYPYVYLLARTALVERASQLMEAARLLGAPLSRRIWQVALPMARPAVAAGVALTLMETLADFGVVSYFGVQTFSAGIYKAWLVLDSRLVAAQLATFLIGLVACLLWVEQKAQQRLRFAHVRGAAGAMEARPIELDGWHRVLAWLVCALPLMMGFVAPLLFTLRPLWAEDLAVPWARYADWAFNSLRLSLIAAILAVAAAVLLAFILRRSQDRVTSVAVELAGLGYAVPGPVIVVGLLLPVGWLQAQWPQGEVAALLTATSLGLLWAYLVRFSAVALQSVRSAYARLPASMDESARLLGAGDWRLLHKVHWPLLRRSVGVAGLLVFVDVMKELPATLVLRPFNSDTLAVVAYQLARDERLGEAMLPSLTLVLVGLVPVILLSRTLRPRDSKPSMK